MHDLWRFPSLSELTSIIVNMELTHLGLKAFIYIHIKFTLWTKSTYLYSKKCSIEVASYWNFGLYLLRISTYWCPTIWEPPVVLWSKPYKLNPTKICKKQKFLSVRNDLRQLKQCTNQMEMESVEVYVEKKYINLWLR